MICRSTKGACAVVPARQGSLIILKFLNLLLLLNQITTNNQIPGSHGSFSPWIPLRINVIPENLLQLLLLILIISIPLHINSQKKHTFSCFFHFSLLVQKITNMKKVQSLRSILTCSGNNQSYKQSSLKQSSELRILSRN